MPRCWLQNHMYKIIYLRHAKIASTSMLNYFGQCSPNRSEDTGGLPGQAVRWWAACRACLRQKSVHAALAASTLAAALPGTMLGLTVMSLLLLQAACAPGSSPSPSPRPKMLRPAPRTCRWATSVRRRCALDQHLQLAWEGIWCGKGTSSTAPLSQGFHLPPACLSLSRPQMPQIDKAPCAAGCPTGVSATRGPWPNPLRPAGGRSVERVFCVYCSAQPIRPGSVPVQDRPAEQRG